MRIFAYNLIFLILLPFTVARIIIKSFLDKDYLTNFHHRFGIYKKISSQKHIWFHENRYVSFLRNRYEK